MNGQGIGPPSVLHAQYLVGHEAMGDTEAAMLGQIKERMAEMLARELADEMLNAKGGLLLSPVTFTINDDDIFGATRVAATVNAHRLPDPDDDLFYLYGGRMNGRSIRVGTPAPEYYRIRVVSPAAIMEPAEPVILEYRLVHGSRAYDFVAELP